MCNANSFATAFVYMKAGFLLSTKYLTLRSLEQHIGVKCKLLFEITGSSPVDMSNSRKRLLVQSER